MLRKAKSLFKLFAFAGMIVALALVFSGAASFASDEEDCLMCHKYSGIGRFDETGRRRIFYIPEAIHLQTVHGALRCRQCHQDIKEIPHTATKGVSCTVDCHLVEPSTKDMGDAKKNFTHTKVANIFEESVHSSKTRRDGTPRVSNKDDVPDCKYCHENPLYLTEEVSKDYITKEEAVVNDVCGQCHENLEWAKRFYGHFTRRVNKRRGAAAMVNLCLSCHEDKELMSRSGLPAINAFEDSFHYKAMKFGDKRVPDCLGCHAPAGFPAHSIKSGQDPDSAVYKDNKLKNTCGLAECHGEKTTAEFAKGTVHSINVDIIDEKTSAKIATSVYKEAIEAQDKFNNIMHSDAKESDDTSSSEAAILNIVRFVYMFLIIAPTLLGMLAHQALDFYATLRERRKKKGGHH